MNKIIWLDTETTGVDPKIHDVIQVAGIIEIDGQDVEEFNLFMAPVSPPEHISPQALETNGRTLQEIMKFLPAQETISLFVSLCEKHVDKYDKNDKLVMAGYNVGFDYQMLRSMWDKAGQGFFGGLFYWPQLDVVSLVAEAIAQKRPPFGIRNFKLETLCEYFNIPIQAHDALSDIRATRELYRRLVSEREAFALGQRNGGKS